VTGAPQENIPAALTLYAKNRKSVSSRRKGIRCKRRKEKNKNPHPKRCGFLFRRVNMKKTIPMIYHGKEISEKIYQARWLL